jgi:hypothetical protein
MWNTENTASLYWFGPLESKTLRPVLRFVLLRIAGLRIDDTRGRLVRLILASGRGLFPDFWSVTTRRPKSTLHILPYLVGLLFVEIHPDLVLYAKS